MKLVEIFPNVLCPTWSNWRCGVVGLAKIHDRFLLYKDICDDFGKYRNWSNSLGFCDHKVVLLQIDFDKSLVKYPFKFNLIWIEDQQLFNFFRYKLVNFSQVHYPLVMYGLIDEMNKLKFEVQVWERVKKVEAIKELEEINFENEALTNIVQDILFSFYRREILQDLEKKWGIPLRKKKILYARKLEQVGLSRVTIIQSFFHKFDNRRILRNTVWKIFSDEGNICHDKKSITNIVVDHFKYFLSQPQGLNFVEQMNRIRNFPHFQRMIFLLLVGRWLFPRLKILWICLWRTRVQALMARWLSSIVIFFI